MQTNLKNFLEHVNSRASIDKNTEIHAYMSNISQEAMQITCELNAYYHKPEKIRKLFSKLIGKEIDDTFSMFPPFYTDFGKNITVGKNVFINSGCKFQDQGGITIGDGTFIGHNVVLCTLNHDFDPNKRGTIIPSPIIIGKNVWIGANVTIVPGVTIGDNAVIAAGAVVTKNVDRDTVAGGVPAKKIKSIYGEKVDNINI